MTGLSNLPQKILLICNRQTTGGLWMYSLQQENFVVRLETNPTNAVRRWSEEIPDVIVIDIDLGAEQVLDLIRRLRSESVNPILLLSAVMTEKDFLEAYRRGVDECISKPFSPSIFIAKVKVWLRRSWSVPIETLEAMRVGSMLLRPAERTITIAENDPVRLTNLELRLTYSLMSNANRTLRSEELIQQVWGYSAQGDSAALKNLIYRLRRKIEANPTRPRMIRTVANSGYKLVSDESVFTTSR